MPGYHPGLHPPIEVGSAKRPTRCIDTAHSSRVLLPRVRDFLDFPVTIFSETPNGKEFKACGRFLN